MRTVLVPRENGGARRSYQSADVLPLTFAGRRASQGEVCRASASPTFAVRGPGRVTVRWSWNPTGSSRGQAGSGHAAPGCPVPGTLPYVVQSVGGAECLEPLPIS